jgi:hypothetical protein
MQTFAGDDKNPTTAIRNLVVHGVDIASRYNKLDELIRMAEAIATLDAEDAKLVEKVFDNSKISRCYTITLRRGWRQGKANPERLADIFTELFNQDSWFNSLTIVDSHTTLAEREGGPQE